MISTDQSLLDLPFIHHFISNSHWAKGRTIEEMKVCADNSLNFGVYLHGQQLGYARVVADYAVFTYIMDLFIDQAHRGKGYSKLLMARILSDDSFKNIKSWKLVTSDANFLYEKFGFKIIEKPGNMMEKKTPDQYSM